MLDSSLVYNSNLDTRSTILKEEEEKKTQLIISSSKTLKKNK